MKKIVYFLPAFLWFILSFILLTLPGDDLPKASIFDLIYLDKWVHIFLFGMMAHLLYSGFKKYFPVTSGAYLQVTLYVWLYGIAIEFIQKYLVVKRSFDITDIIADGVGCLIAYLIFRRQVKKFVQTAK